MDIVRQITTFVTDTGVADSDSPSGQRYERRFEALALEAFAFQYERSEPFRRLCDARGGPASVGSWRDVPAVPTTAYRTLELHTAEPREVFRSSGTMSGPASRSVHRHPFPDLYRRTIDVSFPFFCLPEPSPWGDRGGETTGPWPMLALVPDRSSVPDSSLGFMVEHVLRTWGRPESQVAFGERGVDSEAAASWCAARQGDARSVLVLATAFALAQLFEDVPDADLRLPPGSVVFETGGFKGRRRELGRPELLGLVEARLGVPAERVVREYGMTELTSQFYTRVLHGGDGDVFVGLPWLRPRILDPATLEEARPGEVGIVSVFDLANVGSAVHVLTQDLGRADGDGFRLLGRADGADLRGCSLTVEEMQSGS